MIIKSNNRRKDIDGLRAIAVISVLIYHLNNQYLSSGFVGVDIFFVISGFLITSIILNNPHNNYLIFITKRAKRILPALLFVLALSTIFGYFILIPEDYSHFGKSLRYALTQTSNLLFAKDINYFDKAFENNALLHTWSLGIEWQFYLLWPLILMALNKFTKNNNLLNLKLIISILFISLIISQFFIKIDQKTAFYSLFSRIWEFCCGAVIVLLSKQNIKLKTTSLNAFYCIGFTLIIISMFLVPQNYFPGIFAIPVCLGTAIIIFAGATSSDNKILSSSILQFFGRISYSLYLIHWPIIALYKYENRISSLGIIESILIFITCIILSYVSFRFIEKPFIKLKNNNKKYLIKTLLTYLFIIISFAVIAKKIEKDGFLFRFGSEFNKEIAIGELDPLSKQCFFQTGDKKQMMSILNNHHNCISGNNTNLQAIIIGDSHALHYSPIIFDFAKKKNISAISITGGCPPFITTNVERIYNSDLCIIYQKKMKEIIQNNSIKYVFLAARWDSLSKEIKFINQEEWSLEAFEEGMNSTLKFLKQNDKKVMIMGQVPLIPKEREICLLGNMTLSGRKIKDIKCNVTPQYLNKIFLYKKQFLKKMAAIYDNTNYIDPTNKFCLQENKCIQNINKNSLYRDSNHINLYGTQFLIQNNLLNDL